MYWLAAASRVARKSDCSCAPSRDGDGTFSISCATTIQSSRIAAARSALSPWDGNWYDRAEATTPKRKPSKSWKISAATVKAPSTVNSAVSIEESMEGISGGSL